MKIPIEAPVLSEAKRRAGEFRTRRSESGTLVVNLMSSPGAGKTALLGATAARLAAEHPMAVLVGDIATDRDARRLERSMPARQITTGGACHLEIAMIEACERWLEEMGPLEVLFIENVGNLVCPASFDLGEHFRVVLLAVTEGDDKPQKYPKAFRTADACAISKVDLLPHVPFSIDAAKADARGIRPDLGFFEVSSLTGDGISAWCDFLVENLTDVSRRSG